MTTRSIAAELLACAAKVKKLLAMYRAESEDIEVAAQRWGPIIEDILNGKIKIPFDGTFDTTYFSPHFDLIEHKDLFKAAADLNMYLHGWESEEELERYLDSRIEADEKALRAKLRDQ